MILSEDCLHFDNYLYEYDYKIVILIIILDDLCKKLFFLIFLFVFPDYKKKLLGIFYF